MYYKHVLIHFAVLVFSAIVAQAQVLTLPADQRPEWLAQDGIVMAGSWEPLVYRVRRDGNTSYIPTAEQREAYRREHSPDMVTKLKDLGMNFVMMHCYKGLGLEAERESMQDAVKFAKLCHDAGLRVGVYNYSGAFLWEPFFEEMPEAREWILLDEERQPVTYGRSAYRRYWNRNHPDAVAFYRELVRFAVEDIRTDLVHFDNYTPSAGFDDQSVKDFPQYLRDTFPASRLEKEGIDVDLALPSKKNDPPGLLKFAWAKFQCDYLARSYHDMNRYARSLRKDILVECNPGGVGDHIRPPVDHARILPGGEAFWNEGYNSSWKDGRLESRIRSYKTARLFNNMAFSYIMTPTDAAEAMAFNHPDCLGCVCWFEYANIVNYPGKNDPVTPALEPYIRFYHQRRDLLRGAEVVADVAVLRSFSSQVFADPKYREMTEAVEETLIQQRIPFQTVYDQHLSELKRWPVLVLAGCVALSDRQIEQIHDYAHKGGKLCIVGPVATHDEWMQLRDNPALANLMDEDAVAMCGEDEVIPTIRKLLGDKLSMNVDGPAWLCAELTAQQNRRLVHLVNFHEDQAVKDIDVTLYVPNNMQIKDITLIDPERDMDINIDFEEKDHTVSFVVPTVKTYTIALATFK